jgi:hypothetical protein
MANLPFENTNIPNHSQKIDEVKKIGAERAAHNYVESQKNSGAGLIIFLVCIIFYFLIRAK